MEMVATVRETIGEKCKLRLDANAAWRVNEALRNLARLDAYNIDFIEQPVSQDPLANMKEMRSRCPVAVCANEGLWTAEDAYRQITSRTADIYCFSPYWVGSLGQFKFLCQVAHAEGMQVCKHTHGEFEIAAAAAHHILLTIPSAVDGNQQTTHIMPDGILKQPVPIASGPEWEAPQGPGLGVEVDEEKVKQYHAQYKAYGQFLPYDRALLPRSRYGQTP